MSVIFKLPNKTAKLPEQEALPPEHSDEALALRFAKKHANDARYVAQWDCWFLWDGRRWVKDETRRRSTIPERHVAPRPPKSAICREHP